MTYTLYWSPGSGAFAVELMLIELMANYRLELVDIQDGTKREPAYLAINPMGQVPALALPDGTVITESAAMALHLGEAFPRSGLMPPLGSADRARSYRTLLMLAGPYYEADLSYFYPERYTNEPEGAPGLRAAAKARMDRVLEIIEGGLEPGPYLLGASFCLVDFYLFMTALWHPDRQLILERFPRLGGLLGMVRRRPSVDRLWTRYYPSERKQAWSSWTG